MAAIAPDTLLEGVETAVAAIDPYDEVSAADRFTPVYGAGDAALDSVERDRVLVVLPTSGPLRIPGRSCPTSAFAMALSVRYFDQFESRRRMLRDTTYIETAIREHARTLGVILELRPPTYDYGLLAGQNSVVIRWDMVWEFSPPVLEA